MLDAMNDVREPTLGIEHGRVRRVGAALLAHPVEGGAEVVGIVREDVEHAPAKDLSPLCPGGPEVGLAHRHDLEIGRQHEVEAGRPFEEEAEVGLLHVAGPACPSAACSRIWLNRSNPVFRTTSRASGNNGDPSVATRKPPPRITTCSTMTRP